tara:strand:- start:906 stop:2471 length:1566 start_codon:yes stop_codon:yes gene_type:complete
LAKQDVNELRQFADKVFKDHWPVMSLWQTIADHFYPERADFTQTRNVGQELADSLIDSYPLLVRRDLGNSLSSMLRDGDWFSMGIQGEPDYLGQVWLDERTRMLRQLMYHRQANFVRATREGDHDYVAFGQCVISVELNRKADGLLYRCWHMRDCAWFDDENGQVGGLARKWKPTLRQAVDFFGENAHQKVRDDVNKEPFKEIDVRHLVIPSNMYRDAEIESRFEWVSIYLDVTNNHVMEEVGMDHNQYVVPRFQTIAGSPYAYSPATVVGLPDARCLQAMTHTLLEAGERYARPPIIATQKVIRGDVNLAPDGITWVDDEYDERLGASLRTLPQDRGGFPIGLEMRDTIVQTLNSAFYLNKLRLPDSTVQRTAYEISELQKQYRREALPLFAPIEAEYSGAICEKSFEIAMAAGFLGSQYDIPKSLRGQETQFKFESPLSSTEEEQKATRFSMMSQTLAEAAQFDPSVTTEVNFGAAVRDAIDGLGAPSNWLNDPAQVEQAQMKQMAQQAMESGALTDAA